MSKTKQPSTTAPTDRRGRTLAKVVSTVTLMVFIASLVVACTTKSVPAPNVASKSPLFVPEAPVLLTSNQPATRVDPEDAAAIDTTLFAWARAMKDNDVADELSFYDYKLDRYFLVRNVTRDFVARDKKEFYRRGRRMIDYHIDNVSLDQQLPSGAIVSLVKHWEISDSEGTKSGQTRSRLWLTHEQARWLITGEQDLLGTTEQLHPQPSIPSSIGAALSPRPVGSDVTVAPPTTQDEACRLYPSLC
jgi:hypothetical protein